MITLEEINVSNYKTFKEAKLAILEFIESWYNNKRIHSTLGYITPNQKYQNYISNLIIAKVFEFINCPQNVSKYLT